MSQRQKRNLKRRTFEKDGWQDDDGKWWALCAFGCGRQLDWSTATLDHYPVMKQNGGRFTDGNVRLACVPCNSSNRNSAEFVSKRERKQLTRGQKQILANRNRSINENPKPKDPPPLHFSAEVKRKLKENYPKSEGRDGNGIPVRDYRDVVYDVKTGSFKYD